MSNNLNTKPDPKRRPQSTSSFSMLPSQSMSNIRRVNKAPLKIHILQHKRQDQAPDFTVLDLRTGVGQQQQQQQNRRQQSASSSPSPMKRASSLHTSRYLTMANGAQVTHSTGFGNGGAPAATARTISDVVPLTDQAAIAKKSMTVQEYMERYHACMMQKKELEDFIKAIKKKIIRENEMIRIIQQKQELHYQRATTQNHVEKRSSEQKLQVDREIERTLEEVLLLEEDIKQIKKKNEEVVIKGLQEGEAIQQIKQDIVHMRKDVRQEHHEKKEVRSFVTHHVKKFLHRDYRVRTHHDHNLNFVKEVDDTYKKNRYVKVPNRPYEVY